MVVFTDEHIKKLKAQDPNAFNEFYLGTVDMIFRYINANYSLSKEDAEDVISDFYIKFWEASTHYDDKLSFTWYFWTIFKNVLKDRFKKMTDLWFSELRNADDEEDFGDGLIDEFDITEFLENDFSLDRIKWAMESLDSLSKDILYFKFIEEKSHEEISSITGIALDAVRQRVSRALKNLKWLLNANA